ncbi:phosphodiester glycosidase family protein [Parapedobacter deserti]|uniref:Phosphodiester glycosidase family protein n=1 Tax=Parapedobacter deserti TaxID=1912957 RepID=A0ABV7JQQ5_9SPHI
MLLNVKSSLIVLVVAWLALSCRHAPTGSTDEASPAALLHETTGWTIDHVAEGLVRHHYEGYDSISSARQNVNVVAVDLDEYQLRFADARPSDSLSSIAAAHDGAVAAINGTYYELFTDSSGKQTQSSFFKADGNVASTVTITEGHRYFWKHEGAFFYDPAGRQWGIVYGDKASYEVMPYANVLSGAPMLVYDYQPVGETFAKRRTEPLDSLDYEDPDRHQGVRHPRTAVAITGDAHLLLITVDGRRPETAGMSARELTRFIAHYFNPRYMLNLDGGGSTTLWMESADSQNAVVNYPTDNKRYDHFGQRSIRNAIMVLKKSR